MKLVIAEKPSVAMALTSVLKATKKQDGYIEGSGYIVSWCFGHLLQLAEPDAYGEQYVRWRYEDLPILPEKWKYTVSKDKKKQLSLLCRLMNDKRVDSIICATDAGREGELIFRWVYEYAKCNKPIERLWISSMEDAAIRDGFENLRSGADYDRLYDAAFCRACADWIVGINATRLFSVLYRTTLNVGRVMSPTLALLAQREKEIAEFRVKSFYVPEITCGGFTAAGEKLENKDEAEKLCSSCGGRSASVLSVEKQTKTVHPPRLYNITNLQRDCNRIYGYTAQQTLDYLQSLYEKKLTTYPRTDSRYLTEDMREAVSALIIWLRDNTPFGKGYTDEPNLDRIIDNGKVTDHHAIIPTAEIANADLSGLPTGEQNVLNIIVVRLLCAAGKEYGFEAVTATLDCAGYSFTAKGKTVLQNGWKETEELHRRSLNQTKKEENDKDSMALPEMQKGQIFDNVYASVHKGKTTPPKRYTEDLLLSAMETAGTENMPENSERKGLGTPATRAATIEKLILSGLVERKKKQLFPTQKGMNLILILPENIKSPLLTAEWESKLKQVELGKINADAFMKEICNMSRELIKKHNVPDNEFLKLFSVDGRDPIGTCPRCGTAVYENQKGFFCDNRDCSFALWKDNRFFSSKKKSITKSVAAALLKEGRVFVSGLYSENTGKTYDAIIILDDTGDKYVNFKLEFTTKKGEKKCDKK